MERTPSESRTSRRRAWCCASPRYRPPHARAIPEIDAAVLHLGGGRVGPVRLRMNAADGLALVRRLNARKFIPVHYGDYPEPAGAAGLAAKVQHLPRGGTYGVY